MSDDFEVEFTPDFEIEEDEQSKVVFMPGCFDDFEGTQEELDELIQILKNMVKDKTLFENSKRITEEEEVEFFDSLPTRKLQ